MSTTMTLQSSYNSFPPVAYAGQLETNLPHEIITLKNATTSTSMPFGTPVKFKGSPSTDKDADVLSANTDLVAGLILHSHTYARQWTDSDGNKHGDLDSTGLVPGVFLNVLRRGVVALLLQVAAAVGDKLHCAYNATGSTYTAVGQVGGGSGETGHTVVISQTAFLSSAAAAGFAWCQVDFLGATTTAD